MKNTNKLLRWLRLLLPRLVRPCEEPTQEKPVDPWNSERTGKPFPPEGQLVTVGMMNGNVTHKHYRPAYRKDGEWIDSDGKQFERLGYKVIAWKPNVEGHLPPPEGEGGQQGKDGRHE